MHSHKVFFLADIWFELNVWNICSFLTFQMKGQDAKPSGPIRSSQDIFSESLFKSSSKQAQDRWRRDLYIYIFRCRNTNKSFDFVDVYLIYLNFVNIDVESDNLSSAEVPFSRIRYFFLICMPKNLVIIHNFAILQFLSSF